MTRPRLSLLKRQYIVLRDLNQATSREPTANPSNEVGLTSSPDGPESQYIDSLPFFSFPGEIRNKIYQWAWLMSRERDETYNIPDFQVHGDGAQNGGIRWMNVPSFPLLLVSKQVRKEAFPIISYECWFEIKTYVPDIQKDEETATAEALLYASQCLKTLERFMPLLRSARRISINLTPMYGEWMMGVHPILHQLTECNKLKELTVKAFVSELEPKTFQSLIHLFTIQKLNPSMILCFELSAPESEPWEEFVQKKHRRYYEKALAQASDKYSGSASSGVWVEWILIPSEELDEWMGFPE